MAGEALPGVCLYAFLVLVFEGDFDYSILISTSVVLGACEGIQVVSLPLSELCATKVATSPSGWGVKDVGRDVGMVPR